jgi:hypothetical protein
MKNYDKLYQKYGAMLPPPPDSEKTVVIPTSADEVDPKWIPLLEESEGLDPLTQKPAQTEEELLNTLVESDPPPYEKELLKVLRPEHGVSDESAETIRPGKKANLSSDYLLKACGKFYDLCLKF